MPTIREAYEYNDYDRFITYDSSGQEATSVGLKGTQHVKGRFAIFGQYHNHMETQSCVCVPSEDGMDVHSSTQFVSFNQIAISECLDIPESRINMTLRRIGGAFGAKISRSSQIACACALACHLSKRPVRLVLTMESNMKSIGKRCGLISDYEITVDDVGRIQTMENRFSQDCGSSINEALPESTVLYFRSVYDSTRWTITPQAVITEAPSNTFMRGPCALEGNAMIENMMEHIAKIVNRDPMDVRIQNYAPDHPIKEMATNFLVDIGS